LTESALGALDWLDQLSNSGVSSHYSA
jgi:hypothetical protein